MHQRAYARTIKGGDGKAYQLPTGTYVGSFGSLAAALQDAVAAANATGKASSVIAADWNSASWQGLPVASAARTAWTGNKKAPLSREGPLILRRRRVCLDG